MVLIPGIGPSKSKDSTGATYPPWHRYQIVGAAIIDSASGGCDMPKAIQKFGIFSALVLILSVLATVVPGQSGKTSPDKKSAGQKYANLISYDVDETKWLPKGDKPQAEVRRKFDSTIK